MFRNFLNYFIATIVLIACADNSSNKDNTPPTISLIGSKEIDLIKGNRYIEYGASAYDNIDGDLTDKITIDTSSLNTEKEGTYKVEYSVTDSSGNIATKHRIVNIYKKTKKDSEAPVIKLLGEQVLEYNIGDTYKEPGAKAYDNVDGDISKYIDIDTSHIDMDTEGSYTIRYNVKDSAGNQAKEIIRTIVVVKNVSKPWDNGRLIVDGHMVKHSNGTGFFWMADTAWQLAQKSTTKDIDKYLKDRKDKGFTVVLMSVAEHTEIINPHIASLAFDNNSWRNPNKIYWEHIDYIIKKAEKLGLYIGLLPAWHMFFEREDSKGLTDKNDAAHYGEWIARRYKDKKNIIWVIGGDSEAKEQRVKDVWNALGYAIDEIVGDNHLITYQPTGTVSSSTWFHNEKWLDFNTIQSGHCADMQTGIDNLRRDYHEVRPIKPTLDSEPRYETIEECFYYHALNPPKPQPRPNYRFKDIDVRMMAYKQIFSGAFGHTYGHHSIWQMSPGKNPNPSGGIDATVNSWQEALDAPGARQMGYIVRLIKSRDMLSRVPDDSIVLDRDDEFATRGDGYIFVYLPKGGSVDINLSKISGDEINVSWFDPSTGEIFGKREITKKKRQIFDSKSKKDVVLVLDDASKNYKNP